MTLACRVRTGRFTPTRIHRDSRRSHTTRTYHRDGARVDLTRVNLWVNLWVYLRHQQRLDVRHAKKVPHAPYGDRQLRMERTVATGMGRARKQAGGRDATHDTASSARRSCESKERSKVSHHAAHSRQTETTADACFDDAATNRSRSEVDGEITAPNDTTKRRSSFLFAVFFVFFASSGACVFLFFVFVSFRFLSSPSLLDDLSSTHAPVRSPRQLAACPRRWPRSQRGRRTTSRGQQPTGRRTTARETRRGGNSQSRGARVSAPSSRTRRHTPSRTPRDATHRAPYIIHIYIYIYM